MQFLENDNHDADTPQGDEGENTMAVLNTLGGGDLQPEGQPLGLDAVTQESKLSGSTLAVGAVVVLGLAAVFGLKMTLKASATDANTAEAMLAVDVFMDKLAAAEQAGVQGPIEAATGESTQIITELEADPTEHQVPSDEVQKNPFELVGIVRPERDTGTGGETGPTPEQLEAEQLARYRAIASDFQIDSVTGSGEKAIVFIDGNMYRLGDEIGDTGFTVAGVEGLEVIVLVPGDAIKPWSFRLRYE